MTVNLKPWLPGILAWLALLPAGCTDGGPEVYPVEGRVEYTNGSPFPGGMIQMQRVEDTASPIARGRIESDGTFHMTTPPDKEGVVAGMHRVAVRGLAPSHEPDIGERVPAAKPTIHPRFASFETSDIRVSVEPQRNHLTIKVDRP